jgi:hypothetical protein
VPGDGGPLGSPPSIVPRCFQRGEWKCPHRPSPERFCSGSSLRADSSSEFLRATVCPTFERETLPRRAHCQGSGPHRDIAGSVHGSRKGHARLPNTSLGSVHRLSQPLDGLLRSPVCRPISSRSHVQGSISSRGFSLQEAFPLSSSGVAPLPLPLRRSQSPKEPCPHRGASASRLCSAWSSVLNSR